MKDKLNTYLYSEENKQNDEEDNNANSNETKLEETSKILEKQEGQDTNNEESVNQTEIKVTEESETDRIKNSYAFTSPVKRYCFIRIWDKRSYS